MIVKLLDIRQKQRYYNEIISNWHPPWKHWQPCIRKGVQQWLSHSASTFTCWVEALGGDTPERQLCVKNTQYFTGKDSNPTPTRTTMKPTIFIQQNYTALQVTLTFCAWKMTENIIIVSVFTKWVAQCCSCDYRDSNFHLFIEDLIKTCPH